MTLPYDSQTATYVAVKQATEFYNELNDVKALAEIRALPPHPGSRTFCYEIVGATEQSVAVSGEDFRQRWGPAYMPIVREPRERKDGTWVALATRWHSAD